MGSEERPRFLDRGEERHFSAGESLWSNEEEALVCYVLSGEILYSFPHEADESQIVCREGMLLGIVDTHLQEASAIFSAKATKDSQVYCWTREQFSLALGIYQELARQTIQTLSKRVRNVNELLRRAKD
mgnify:CR=1 FL=1